MLISKLRDFGRECLREFGWKGPVLLGADIALCCWMFYRINLYTLQLSRDAHVWNQAEKDCSTIANRRCAVLFVSTSDYNGALLSPPSEQAYKSFINAGLTPVFKRVNTLHDIERWMHDLIKRNNSIEVLEITAHGSPTILEFQNDVTASSDRDQLSRVVNNVAFRGTILLKSCNTGNTSSGSTCIAEALSKFREDIVILAPAIFITDMEIEGVFPLKIKATFADRKPREIMLALFLPWVSSLFLQKEPNITNVFNRGLCVRDNGIQKIPADEFSVPLAIKNLSELSSQEQVIEKARLEQKREEGFITLADEDRLAAISEMLRNDS